MYLPAKFSARHTWSHYNTSVNIVTLMIILVTLSVRRALATHVSTTALIIWSRMSSGLIVVIFPVFMVIVKFHTVDVFVVKALVRDAPVDKFPVLGIHGWAIMGT